MSDIHVLIQVFVDAKQVKSAKTSDGYRRLLNQFALHLNGAPPTPEAVNGWLASCKKRGLRKSTIESYHQTVKNWLTWLIKRGYIEQFRLDLIETPPRGKLVPRAPTQAALRAVISLLREKFSAATPGRKITLARDLAMFSLLLDCGMRIGEICALTIYDIDMDMRKIHIEDSKTSRGRTLYFTEAAGDDLRQWLAYRPPCDDIHIFLTKRNGLKLATPEGTRAIFSRYQSQANVSHFRVHDLRHACAVYRLAAGQSLGDIQNILGHENIESTARYLKAVDMGRAERDCKYSPVIML